jgi:hypothetical protein
METEKRKLLDVFRKLDPENRAELLAYVQVAYAAQEHTKRRYGLLAKGECHKEFSQPSVTTADYGKAH